MKKRRKTNKGITLVALVITVIILLILAGIVISSLTGDNGLFKRAKEARQNTLDAQNKEKVTLEGYEDTISSTVGVDWEYALANATKHPDQKTSTAIGVGTDGKPVNMDLWEYTKLDDGTYGLNDEDAFLEEDYVASSGYDNNNLIEEKIQGTIPEYIKDSSDEEFVPVTNLNYLFYNTDLSEAPIIPDTVTSMRGTFNSTKITKMPEIPNGVANMYGTFANCTNLVETCAIPDSVIDMGGTFSGCSSLTVAPKLSDNTTTLNRTFYNCISLINAPIIPDKIEKMDMTFAGCTNLTTVKVIPESVRSLKQTFQRCINLKGEIEINANITEISNWYIPFYNATTANGATLKLKGSCPVLSEIVTNANNPNITL